MLAAFLDCSMPIMLQCTCSSVRFTLLCWSGYGSPSARHSRWPPQSFRHLSNRLMHLWLQVPPYTSCLHQSGSCTCDCRSCPIHPACINLAPTPVIAGPTLYITPASIWLLNLWLQVLPYTSCLHQSGSCTCDCRSYPIHPACINLAPAPVTAGPALYILLALIWLLHLWLQVPPYTSSLHQCGSFVNVAPAPVIACPTLSQVILNYH